MTTLSVTVHQSRNRGVKFNIHRHTHMAGGWSKDGAIQDQIDASVQDAVDRARNALPRGDSLTHCEECDKEIPAARRQAVAGVRLCVNCQQAVDEATTLSSYNRRGSKDSQLR